MRLLLFCYITLTDKQKRHVKAIVGFIVSVYLPTFLRIHLNPAACEGPANMLFCRNLFLAYRLLNEELYEQSVKRFFLGHARNWLDVNMPVSVFSRNPPYSVEAVRDPAVVFPRAVELDKLLTTRAPLTRFFTKAHESSPCLTRGTPAFWRGIENNNRACERTIGSMNKIFRKRTIIDSKTPDEIPTVDEKIRGSLCLCRKNRDYSASS